MLIGYHQRQLRLGFTAYAILENAYSEVLSFMESFKMENEFWSEEMEQCTKTLSGRLRDALSKSNFAEVEELTKLSLEHAKKILNMTEECKKRRFDDMGQLLQATPTEN